MADRVFINGRAAVHAGSAGRATAFPDVCLCPPTPPAGPVPTPLPNTVVAADLTGGAGSVLIESNAAGKRSSRFAKSTGNEIARATGGGVVSHAVQGPALFASHAMNVMFEGEPAVRHFDMLTQNHLAPGPPGNTPPSVWTSAMAPPSVLVAPSQSARRVGDDRHRIDIALLDDASTAGGVAYQVKTPDGRTVEGRVLAGGAVALLGLPAGSCKLSLPEIDAASAPLDAPALDAAPAGTLAYQKGRALELAVGQIHRVAVPLVRTLWVDLPITASQASARTDRFVLTSKDGALRVERVVSRDQARHDGRLTLGFSGLQKGGRYTLVHDQGPAGVHEVFADVPFEELFPSEELDYEPPEVQAQLAPHADDDIRMSARAIHAADEDEEPDEGE